MSNWIPTKDVAKLVRAELKRNWDGGKGGWKYSVRSDSYAGGSAVRITVPKNFSQEAEQALRQEFHSWGSAGFDGMTDSSYSKSHRLCPKHGVSYSYVGSYFGHNEERFSPCCEHAEDVHLGASYVTVSREW
jgi:hypothetical protein